ncbi:hypothetical protein FRB91_006631 [Serendipita sp. 411]|nr:hypothetical protein FRB91_006631 [Serendipita sp. 411]
MRVRVLTIPPLPHVKAWFEIPSFITSSGGTIESLKIAICEQMFKPDNGTKFHHSQISLEVDQYELLDHSSAQIVRENDLIEIKLTQQRLSGVKRKREQYEATSFALKKASQPPMKVFPLATHHYSQTHILFQICIALRFYLFFVYFICVVYIVHFVHFVHFRIIDRLIFIL